MSAEFEVRNLDEKEIERAIELHDKNDKFSGNLNHCIID